MEIKRYYFNKLYGEMDEPFISVLIGARQVGKSTLMNQLFERIKSDGKRASYFNLEFPEDLQKLNGSTAEVIQTLTAAGEVIFIDEFHYLKNATKIFKSLYDSKRKIKIYASGSSSIEIHTHLKESLAGRFRSTMIFPFSFDEYLKAPNTNLGDYFRFGGMPGLIHESSDEKKILLLANIISTYLVKDVRALVKEENVRPFNHLLYLLAQSQGSLCVAASLARETGMTEPTVARYLDIMEHTFTAFPVVSYAKNLGNELKKSKKFYLFDVGIRNTLLKDFSGIQERPDKGVLNESFVYLHLRRQILPNMEIRFWRTKRGDEVDFVVVKNRKPIPIEVKSGLKTLEIPKGLVKFLQAYPDCPSAYVYNDTLEDKVTFNKTTIYFRPLHRVSHMDELQAVED